MLLPPEYSQMGYLPYRGLYRCIKILKNVYMKSVLKATFLKLATNYQNDISFLSLSNFCPKRLSGPRHKAMYIFKSWKIYTKSDLKRITIKYTINVQSFECSHWWLEFYHKMAICAYPRAISWKYLIEFCSGYFILSVTTWWQSWYN